MTPHEVQFIVSEIQNCGTQTNIRLGYDFVNVGHSLTAHFEVLLVKHATNYQGNFF
jgi:hypothetical protein